MSGFVYVYKSISSLGVGVYFFLKIRKQIFLCVLFLIS